MIHSIICFLNYAENRSNYFVWQRLPVRCKGERTTWHNQIHYSTLADFLFILWRWFRFSSYQKRIDISHNLWAYWIIMMITSKMLLCGVEKFITFHVITTHHHRRWIHSNKILLLSKIILFDRLPCFLTNIEHPTYTNFIQHEYDSTTQHEQ